MQELEDARADLLLGGWGPTYGDSPSCPGDRASSAEQLMQGVVLGVQSAAALTGVSLEAPAE